VLLIADAHRLLYRNIYPGEGVVTLSQIERHSPITANAEAWDFNHLVCCSIAEIRLVSLDITTLTGHPIPLVLNYIFPTTCKRKNEFSATPTHHTTSTGLHSHTTSANLVECQRRPIASNRRTRTNFKLRHYRTITIMAFLMTVRLVFVDRTRFDEQLSPARKLLVNTLGNIVRRRQCRHVATSPPVPVIKCPQSRYRVRMSWRSM
jgi:hypothetical protein